MNEQIDALSVGLPGAGLQVLGLQTGCAALPLLLLHGGREWSHVWHPVMSRFAHRFELIAIGLHRRTAR